MINFIKFIHLLFALGLLGLVMRNAILTGPKRQEYRFEKIMLVLALCALLTGTLLVYPKNFTFHTPWIQAAYTLVSIFCLIIFGNISFKKNNLHPHWIMNVSYSLLMILLVFVVHDAVTKTTLLFK